MFSLCSIINTNIRTSPLWLDDDSAWITSQHKKIREGILCTLFQLNCLTIMSPIYLPMEQYLLWYNVSGIHT